MRRSLSVCLLWIIVGRDVSSANAFLSRETDSIINGVEYESPTTAQDAESQHLQRSLILWSAQDFPNLSTNYTSCRNDRICDPDSVLTPKEMESVALLVQDFEETQSIPCPNADAVADAQSWSSGIAAIRVQLAIALVNNMGLSSFSDSDDPEMKAAEYFCRSLHNSWGVGDNVPICGGGTGIVIFVSALDRALYISRGGALDRILTDGRLDNIIDTMKPWFRHRQYGDGLKAGIHQISEYMKLGLPENSGGLVTEELENLFSFLVNLVVVAFFCRQAVRMGWKRWKFARVARQLRQLDRARAEALQGKYHTTSCPICLEDFQMKPPVRPSCCCNNHVEREPIVALTAANHNHAVYYDTSLSDNSNIANMQGSDGLPLKLLSCGHVYDQSCWAEWVRKGGGSFGKQSGKCPICQQNVGEIRWDGGVDNRVLRGLMNGDNDIDINPFLEQQYERVLDRHQRERYFRLTRLSSRYPQYVQPQQIQILWTQPTYDTRLVHDSTFVNNNSLMRMSSATDSSGSSSGGISFGG